MRRQRRDPELQAQYMIDAWGEDKGRKLCQEAINVSSNKTRGTYRTNQETQYWRDVLSHFPKLPPPVQPSFIEWDAPAMVFMRTHGIDGVLSRSSKTKSGWVIEIDPCQEKFVAASISG